MSETACMPPWSATYPQRPQEVFDPDLATDVYHPKRYAWLTPERVQGLQAPDTSPAHFPKNWTEKGFWIGFLTLYAISAWLTLVGQGTDDSQRRGVEAVRVTLAHTPAATPGPTASSQPIAEAAAPPVPKPPPSEQAAQPLSSTPVPSQPQPRPLTIPGSEPTTAPPAAPLRQGTTVFDPRLRQTLESTEIAEINTRTQRPQVQHFWRSPNEEVYGCQRVLHDPVIGEMWIIGNMPGCKPQRRVRRFGRQLEADN